MSRDLFEVKDEFIGTGLLTDYEYDIKVQSLAHMKIKVYDDEDNLETEVLGTDTTELISSIDNDAVNGGGTITLLEALPDGYTMQILLAPDEPTQPYQFKNKGEFTLPRIEQAFDWLAGAIQRLAYLGRRSLKLDDLFDIEDFDPTIPYPLLDRAYLRINEDGDGFEWVQELLEPGSTFDDVSPMTTEGDIIIGGTDGDAIRLARGADNAIFAMDTAGERPRWLAKGTSAALLKMNAAATALEWLAKGTAGQLLRVASDGNDLEYFTSEFAPPGVVQAYAGSAAPTGWLLCYGQAVSRTTYAALFAVIGTDYGVGDGSTTFNLPDLRGRTIAGPDNMGGSAASRLTNTTMTPDGNTRGAVGGTQTHTLVSGEIPSHTHTQDSHIHIFKTSTNGETADGAWFVPLYINRQGDTNSRRGSTAAADNNPLPTTATNQNTGGGGAHLNVQPTMVLNMIIKT